MSRYTIAIKKDGAEYSISSDDKEFIALHIKKVFLELSDIPNLSPVDNIAKLDIEKANTVSQPAPSNVSIEPEKNTEAEQVQVEQICEEQDLVSEEEYEIKDVQEDEVVSLSNSLSETNVVEEEAAPAEEFFLEPPVEEEQSQEQKDFSFENILEDKLQTQEEQASAPVESSFDYEAIIKMKQPESLVDYLIITAYYMLENEDMETFQLKQLNVKLFKSMKMVVDRKTMQKAIEEGLVDVVSSGSENDGITEYILTPKGREFYINGCA